MMTQDQLTQDHAPTTDADVATPHHDVRKSATAASPSFDYAEAFSRNIGWVTRQQQETLANKTVAIAGLGGVGGQHLVTLARMGIGGFRLAEFDRFEIANFNRQMGAAMSTVGRPKLDVMRNLALDINPNLRIETFDDGITDQNVDTFMKDADLFVDGIDFFAVKARRSLFAACDRHRVPAITAAPLGMGVSWLNFLPGRTTFEQYFQLEGRDETEQLLRFLVGLAPAGLHRKYLVDPSTINLAAHRGPSTPMAVALCAGVAGAHAVKILLGRGNVPAAPTCLQFDAYRDRFVRSWRPGGNANPLQRLALFVGRRTLKRQQRNDS